MRHYHSLDQFDSPAPIAMTIGAFDGIHLGHRRLIDTARSAADRIDGESAVMTFDPHPDRVLWPDRERLYLTSLPERIALIRALGVDHLLVLPFDVRLSRVPADQFMTMVCQAMRLRELWIGPDFRLGAGGRGNAGVLGTLGQQLGYAVHQVERVQIDGRPVSSTAIRDLLDAGDVRSAASLLGRHFGASGEVVHGDHRGRTIGVPTANVAVAEDHVVPAHGVYASYVFLPDDQHPYPAVTNVGVRPTFGVHRRTVETHLLDWSGDLYGQVLRVAFVERLRGEQKFSGIDALIAQIKQDIAAARAFLTT